MDKFLEAAIEEAQKGLDEGGIPIGFVLVIDGKVLGRGHNRRVQKGSAILHASGFAQACAAFPLSYRVSALLHSARGAAKSRAGSFIKKAAKPLF